MSYNTRRAPNVSQYLANLNTIPSAQDLQAQDFSSLDDSLDFLTNTDFVDFDAFNGGEFAGQPGADLAQQQGAKPAQAGLSGAPFNQFSEFQTYPSLASSPTSIQSPQNLQGVYPPPGQHYAGQKRKSSAGHIPSAADLEEQSRMAAEEDKRRRNTAASARFRVKKKQREQALEKQAKDMSDKVQSLETKVEQLEMENKWLKGLITEQGAKAKEGAATVTAKDVEEQEKEVERSMEKRSDGVGTPAAAKVDA